MRTDKTVASAGVNQSPGWRQSEVADRGEAIDTRLEDGQDIVDGKPRVHSLSGHERNHLFLNQDAGREFKDISALSGLDTDADSRCFVTLDYDRDGWLDVALVNANVSPLQLYHNDIADLPGMSGGMIAVQFEGGSTTDGPSELSNRDGYGAMVVLALPGGTVLKREHRCGDGYAAQNSATLHIGIGQHAAAERVTVRWPSGREFSVDDVPEGTLLTAYENREAGAFTRKRYRVEGEPAPEFPRAQTVFPLAQESPAEVQVYTTTATWCAACLSHLPALEELQDSGAALFGVPVDPTDNAAKLAEYVEQKHPPYEMLADTGAAEREAVTAFLAAALLTENPALPSSVITDGDGNVLEVMQGVPTISQVRKWMR